MRLRLRSGQSGEEERRGRVALSMCGYRAATKVDVTRGTLVWSLPSCVHFLFWLGTPEVWMRLYADAEERRARARAAVYA